MLDLNAPLIAEFLKDHQQFSRLMFEIAKLLDDEQIDQARVRAKELNEVAGPHIAYEESELYTRLGELGVKSVTRQQLAEEHREVLDALKMLLDDPAPNGKMVESIKQGFRSGLTHAEHCGSLMSLMAGLNEQQRSESLKKLIHLREHGRNWTELS